MNVDSLRRRRAKKLGVKAAGHAGQRRIFFVLERGTQKFHGELSLWMQYLDYSKHAKANKKFIAILDKVLRLHPTKPGLWIYASQHHIAVEADFVAARNCMQAGMRFCPRSAELWLEYARLETAYLAKLVGRRKLMGLESNEQEHKQREEASANEEDVIRLPAATYGEVRTNVTNTNKPDEISGRDVESLSILRGGIPRAIYEDAIKRFPKNHDLQEQFLDMLLDFQWIGAIKELTEYIVENMLKEDPISAQALACRIKLLLMTASTQSPDFPELLSNSLREIDSYAKENPTQAATLLNKLVSFLSHMIQKSALDSDVELVIRSSMKKYSRALQNMPIKDKSLENKFP